MPPDYLDIIEDFGGREGFLGGQYLRLYHLDEIASLNTAYDVAVGMPGCVMFGSDGAGEAFMFAALSAQVVQVPPISMCTESAVTVSRSFTEFVELLAAGGPTAELDPSLVGKVVHEIQPIVFGGSPTDPKNKALVPPAAHAEIARYWNAVYRRMQSERQ